MQTISEADLEDLEARLYCQVYHPQNEKDTVPYDSDSQQFFPRNNFRKRYFRNVIFDYKTLEKNLDSIVDNMDNKKNEGTSNLNNDLSISHNNGKSNIPDKTIMENQSNSSVQNQSAQSFDRNHNSTSLSTSHITSAPYSDYDIQKYDKHSSVPVENYKNNVDTLGGSCENDYIPIMNNVQNSPKPIHNPGISIPSNCRQGYPNQSSSVKAEEKNATTNTLANDNRKALNKRRKRKKKSKKNMPHMMNFRGIKALFEKIHDVSSEKSKKTVVSHEVILVTDSEEDSDCVLLESETPTMVCISDNENEMKGSQVAKCQIDKDIDVITTPTEKRKDESNECLSKSIKVEPHETHNDQQNCSDDDDDVIFVTSKRINDDDEVLSVDDDSCTEEDGNVILAEIDESTNKRNSLNDSNKYVEDGQEADATYDFLDTQSLQSGSNLSVNCASEETFMKPINRREVYESGSSSTSECHHKFIKPTVFNEIDFPQEDIFADGNWEKFKNLISTPKPSTSRKRSRSEKCDQDTIEKESDSENEHELEISRTTDNFPHLSSINDSGTPNKKKRKYSKNKSTNEGKSDNQKNKVEDIDDLSDTESTQQKRKLKKKRKKSLNASDCQDSAVDDQLDSSNIQNENYESQETISDNVQVANEEGYKKSKKKRKRSEVSYVSEITNSELEIEFSRDNVDVVNKRQDEPEISEDKSENFLEKRMKKRRKKSHSQNKNTEDLNSSVDIKLNISEANGSTHEASAVDSIQELNFASSEEIQNEPNSESEVMDDDDSLVIIDEVGSSDDFAEAHQASISQKSADTGYRRKRFGDIWNPDKDVFYQKPTNVENFEIPAVQSTMSDDPKLWHIVHLDKIGYRSPPGKGGRCRRCREYNHIAIRCPNKPGPPKCVMCGLSGHMYHACPNKLCIRCGKSVFSSVAICRMCVLDRHRICETCHVKGHTSKHCPDIWRRYHLTTAKGPLQKPNGTPSKSQKKIWCCICALPGHFANSCPKNYNNRSSSRIHSYDDVYKNYDFNINSNGSQSQSSKDSSYVHRSTKIQNNLFASNFRNTFTNRPHDFDNLQRGTQNYMPNFIAGNQFNMVNTAVRDHYNSYNEIPPLPNVNASGFLVPMFSGSYYQPVVNMQVNNTYHSTGLNIPNSRKPQINEPELVQRFIMNEPKEMVRDFLREELAKLDKFHCDVRSAEGIILRYENHPNLSVHESRDLKQAYQHLNMLFFGIHCFEEGKKHLLEIKQFVNAYSKKFKYSKRHRLWKAYNYIFGNVKHSLNYSRCFQQLNTKSFR